MSRYRRFPFAHVLSQLLRFSLPALVVAMSARGAGAQGFSITEGSRIKVSATGLKSVAGIVRSVNADSTTIFVDGQSGILKFANRDVTSMKISGGRTHAEGAKKGLMWGGAFGALLAGAVYATPDGNNDYEYPAYSKSRLAVNSFIGSLIWGAGLGALIKGEEWNDMPLHPSVAKTSGGMGLSFAFSPSFLH